MQRKALFVGIDDYTQGIPALSCARNDANALLQYFLKHGYTENDVSILRNGKTGEILDKLKEQTKELLPGDLFLFFFAGHGYTIEKTDGSFDRNLAGADDRPSRIKIGKDGISLSEIKDLADKTLCSFIVILDACQTKIDIDRTVDDSSKDICKDRDIIAISSVVNRKRNDGKATPFLVINSCDVGEVAYEMEMLEQGLFTFSLLEVLKQMDSEGKFSAFDEELLVRISNKMDEYGGGCKQHPKLIFSEAYDLHKIPIFPDVVDSHDAIYVVCPVCGKNNLITDTFKCNVCGKNHFCLSHRQDENNICGKCEMKQRERAQEMYSKGVACEDKAHGRLPIFEKDAKWQSKAAEWYRKAAKLGHVEAQYQLSVMYNIGRGVVQNNAEAGKWLRMAAERGHAKAQYDLGEMYEHGYGVAKSIIEAMKWYRKAAEQGDYNAQFCLAEIYANGDSLMRNEVEATKWYRRAAERGVVRAQYKLGERYEHGRGDQRNYVEAVKWYRKVAEWKNEEAQKAISRLMQSIISDERVPFGECMRSARLAKGYSTEQIAAKTGMLVEVVQELENDDFHRNMTPNSGRGFVKLYAECVGLDPAPLIEKFMNEYNAQKPSNGVLRKTVRERDCVAKDAGITVRQPSESDGCEMPQVLMFGKGETFLCAGFDSTRHSTFERDKHSPHGVATVQLWEGGPCWADRNIGAEEPWASGYYFWWGDTIGYKRENDAWMSNDGSLPKFSFGVGTAPTYEKTSVTLQNEGWITVDGVLVPEHDAAHVHWGAGWRMPTGHELLALETMCDWERTMMNGVDGYVVRGRGGYASASIFLPASGYGRGSSLCHAGSYGYYWSSEPMGDFNYYSWGLCFYSGRRNWDGFCRYNGRTVRSVQGLAKS